MTVQFRIVSVELRHGNDFSNKRFKMLQNILWSIVMIKVMKTAAYTEQLFLHVYPLRLAFNFISKSHKKK